MKDKLKIIQSNFHHFNDIPYINSGGCGLFAENLYNALKRLNFKPQLAIITPRPEQTKEVIQNNRGCNETEFNHILVYVGGRLIDNEGIYDKRDFSIHELVIGLSVELLHEWNKNPKYWNDTFNRKKYCKKILTGFEKIVNKFKEKDLVN